MGSDPAIVVEGVSKHFRRPQEQVHTLKERVLHPFRPRSYDRFTAVSDVSFSVERGEFFGIVGRNGSGKSTLLKMLAGIYTADGGEVWINGRVSTFIELGVGFNPDLAARDNVILNAVMLGLPPAEARERYERVIEFAELREFADLKLKNYSSGMHVRLAFSVMIEVDADVLLIDEVLAVGDAAFQQKCFDQFNRLRDEGRTIVLVTHDMGAVKRFCHRGMLMEKGVVEWLGNPELVGARYLDMNFRRDQGGGEPEDEEGSEHGDRFGDGAARTVNVYLEDAQGEWLRDTVSRDVDELVIKCIVEFHRDLPDPALSIAIQNEQHQTVFATSTQWTEERTGAWRAGDRAELAVRLPNVLAPGRYYVMPTIARRGGELQLADRWHNALSFVVTGTYASGGIVELEHDIWFTRYDREVSR
jgi:ABC-type polysaccharide/polyol phosphate transport system ATPase subunit